MSPFFTALDARKAIAILEYQFCNVLSHRSRQVIDHVFSIRAALSKVEVSRTVLFDMEMGRQRN